MKQVTEFEEIIAELNRSGIGEFKLRKRRSKAETQYFLYALATNPLVYSLTLCMQAVMGKFPKQAFLNASGAADADFRILTPEQRASGKFEKRFYEVF